MPDAEEPARTLSDYLAIVRRRWWLVALVTVVTVGAAGAYTYRQPTVYRSVMKIVVGQGRGIFLPEVGNVAEQFTQTMSDLLHSDITAVRAIRQLGLPMTAAHLLANLQVVTKPESAVLEVDYDDTDPVQGRQILNEVGVVFSQLVDQRLATRSGGGATDRPVSATVFDPAHTLTQPVQPKPARNIGVAFVLGVLFGFVAAFVREHFDDTIRSIDEAERAFGMVATATVPTKVIGHRPLDPDRARTRDPLLVDFAMQRMRAGILWVPEAENAKSLLITSAMAEEGKSTIAANLAVTMALDGLDVIIVEADLRRPLLHRYLRQSPPVGGGLDAVAQGRLSLGQAMIDIPLPHRLRPVSSDRTESFAQATANGQRTGRLRAILGSGDQTGWPAELGFQRTHELMQELRREADIVVIDAPPILIVSDAYPLAAAADIVVAVVRNGASTRADTAALRRTLDRLQVRRLDLVVTDSNPGHTGIYDSRYRHVPRVLSRGARERSRF